MAALTRGVKGRCDLYFNPNYNSMKKFLTQGYLDFLFALTVLVLLFSVFFTFVAGESPIQALDIDPAIAALSSGAMLLVLVVIPFIIRKLKNPAA